MSKPLSYSTLRNLGIEAEESANYAGAAEFYRLALEAYPEDATGETPDRERRQLREAFNQCAAAAESQARRNASN